ncbi:MAG: hypothetical protein ACLPG5_12695 [Acidocella sp.]
MAAGGFLEFARRAMAAKGQVPARHHEMLIGSLQDVADGAVDRLMVQMPPGSAKSTYGSVLFPAYFLAARPRAQVIAAAHTASLANYFGRRVRAAVEENGSWLGVASARTARTARRHRASPWTGRGNTSPPGCAGRLPDGGRI